MLGVSPAAGGRNRSLPRSDQASRQHAEAGGSLLHFPTRNSEGVGGPFSGLQQV